MADEEVQVVLHSVSSNDLLIAVFNKIYNAETMSFNQIYKMLPTTLRKDKRKTYNAFYLYRNQKTLTMGAYRINAISTNSLPLAMQDEIHHLRGLMSRVRLKVMDAIAGQPDDDPQRVHSLIFRAGGEQSHLTEGQSMFWDRFSKDDGLMMYARSIALIHEKNRDKRESRVRKIGYLPKDVFIMKYHARDILCEVKTHYDGVMAATTLFCLQQHEKEYACLMRKPSAYAHDDDFVPVPYDTKHAIVLSPYVIHRVSPPRYGDRVILSIFW